MRVFAVLLVALALGGCETVNYYGDADGGVGEVDDMQSRVFSDDSKLQGNDSLALNLTPSTLIDVRTRDGQPHMLTVALSRYGLPIAYNIGNPEAEVVGQLYIGVAGGTPAYAEVDWIEGTVLSLPASQLRVDAVFQQYDRTIAGPAWWTGLRANAQAALSEGVVAHGRTPQRTFTYETLIAPAGVARGIPIPAFAKSFRVTARPNNSVLTVNVWNINGAIEDSYVIAAFPSADLPLSAGARFIEVVNSAAINLLAFRLIFELGL